MADGSATQTTEQAPPSTSDPAPDAAANEGAIAPEPQIEVGEPPLEELADSGAKQSGQIDILLDTTMDVSVRLASVELPLRRLLQLANGSVISLNKPVGEPVDLLLRGVKFATGQLVVVGDQLGIRIKEIVAAQK